MNYRVLFVGNSGTHVNDMPKIFEHIAQSVGIDCLCEKEAPDSMRLVQHSDPQEECGKELINKLAEFRPTIVFFQENGNVLLGTDGRYPQENARIKCAAAAKKLVEMARQVGAKPYFYIRTAYEYEKKGADRKLQGRIFRDFFGILGALLNVPCADVSRAFDLCIEECPTIDPYGPDRAHHSKAGSYLVACTCFAKVFGTDFETVSPWELDPDTAATLWNIARRAAKSEILEK
ncbi:MAG: hypothetical protein IKB44_04560 [Clostridia bacterium]|nr:hypothetical protein [Clostridia bacterium]MBR2473203.1 hypothetical protein [Clostridia bacterium]